MAYHQSSKNVIATAGEDSTIQIFDQSSRRILASIEEHFKKVNDLAWMDDAFLVSASSDKSVRVWIHNEDDWEMNCGLTLRMHEAEVVAVTCSRNGRIIISASKDATLGFIDLEQGKCLERLFKPDTSPYAAASFHPDGRWVASGTEGGEVQIWDTAQSEIVQTLPDEGNGAILGVDFHENGQYFATATAESVKLWDVRTWQSFKYSILLPEIYLCFR